MNISLSNSGTPSFTYFKASRYFTTLDGTSDYFTIPTVSLTADFIIEFDYSATVNGSVIGDIAVDTNFLVINSDTQIIMRMGGTTVTSWATSGLLNGKLNHVKVVRTTGIVEIYVNNISIGTQIDSDTFTFSAIGDTFGQAFFNGVIANVKITDAGTLIRDYKVDETWDGSTALIDYGTDGSNGTAVSITTSNAEQFTLLSGDYISDTELITNGDFDSNDFTWWSFVDVPWDASTGKAVCDGTQVGFSAFGKYSTVSTSLVYRYNHVISGYSAGSLKIGGTTAPNITSNGIYSIISQGYSTTYNVRGTLDFVGSVDSLSVKRILEAPQTAAEIIADGSSVLWLKSDVGITMDGSNLVSLWADQSGNGNDLVQAGADADKPTWNSNGVLFDGVANYMKAVAFTLVQPEFIYIVFKQVTWTDFDRVFDGNLNSLGMLRQRSGTPDLRVSAGTSSASNTNLPLDTYGIARVQFNGASSTYQINETTQITSDFGAADMGGFTLGSKGDATANFSNIEVKEVIIRNTADSTFEEGTIYNYLADKYSI